MKFLTATRLKQLGVDVWPVRTPAFLDEFSHPGFTAVRTVEVRIFPTEKAAIDELSKSPWPRFALDICPQEVAVLNNPDADKEPKDHYYARVALGRAEKPMPGATLEVFKRP
jgi:hypothetical protein